MLLRSTRKCMETQPVIRFQSSVQCTVSKLAFLPPAEAINRFEALFDIAKNNFEDKEVKLSDYFEGVYSDLMLLRGIHHFLLIIQNMFIWTNHKLPRNSGNIEGFCFCFYCFYFFFFWGGRGLKKEKTFVCSSILHQLGGHSGPALRRRYADCNALILSILDYYSNRLIAHFRSNVRNLAF